VDGADFNNPFFGEQRGGTRPAFTFNLDAVQEVVVVADGANAEFGRSSGGFINVVTSRGPTTSTEAPTGTTRATVVGGGADAGRRIRHAETGRRPIPGRFTFGGPIMQDKFFYFLSGDYQNGNETKQLDPNRIEQRVVDQFAAFGSPDENGSITRGDDALALLAKIDWRVTDSTSPACVTSTPGRTSRTARSTSIPGAGAPTRSRRSSRRRSPAPCSRHSRRASRTSFASSSPARTVRVLITGRARR
jgi:hypothetical protein